MMKQPVVIIYVPGISDHALQGRQLLTKTWHYRDIGIKVCRMQWAHDEPWNDKLNRLLDDIDTLYAQHKAVVLIGESAGASAVMHALQHREDKLQLAVLLCGKSQYPERVANQIYQKNPAFKPALIASHAIVQNLSHTQRTKLINWRPILDLTVPVWETKIPGVKNIILPTILHAPSIVLGMTLYKRQIINQIRKHIQRGDHIS